MSPYSIPLGTILSVAEESSESNLILRYTTQVSMEACACVHTYTQKKSFLLVLANTV